MGPDLARADALHITHAVAYVAQLHPDLPALGEFREGRWQMLTFADLDLAVRRLASGLIHLGIAPGERVGLVGGNSPAWSTAYFAILLAGAVVVPLDRLQTPIEWVGTLRRAGVSVVLGAAHELQALKRTDAERPALRHTIWLSGTPSDRDLSLEEVQRLTGDPAVGFPPRAPDDLAVIIFTSGTTGESKGVMLSHRNIVSDARAVLDVVDLNPAQRFLSVLPLSHAYESTCGLVAPLLAGVPVCYARSLTPSEIVADLRSSRATFLLAVPLLVEKMAAGIERALKKQTSVQARLVRAVWGGLVRLPQPWRGGLGRALLAGVRKKAGLEHLRYLICGSAPLAAEASRRFEALGLKFLQGYGLTETSPVATLTPPDEANPASVGKPLPGVEVRLVDTDAEGSGEILIRGPIVMQGYWQDPEATAQALRDGWLRTGDRGRFDRRGNLHITGRSKLLIITPGGKNISPEEIELALLRSPFVAECIVYGAPVRQGAGEEVAAKIHPDLDYVAEWQKARGGQVDLKALLREEIDRVTAHLAHYKHVVQFTIEPEPFTKTTSQKIKRHLHIEAERNGSA